MGRGKGAVGTQRRTVGKTCNWKAVIFLKVLSLLVTGLQLSHAHKI